MSTETTLPEQPDGIESDSHDMPSPITAALRVINYVDAMGDGIYDVAAAPAGGAGIPL